MATGTVNEQGPAPGGLSWTSFKAISAETGTWLWGTVQGAFNEKASFSQIVVDAVVGMIPLVGDVTAARDLIAVTIGLVDEPAKREKVWEWVLLVVLVFALIPVIGGVIKGVGRLVIKLAKEAEALTEVARAAHLAEGVKEIVAFLNRVGVKNAEAWLKGLRAADYQTQLLERFHKLMDVLIEVLVQIRRKAGTLMPAGLGHRIDGIKSGVGQLKAQAAEMVPKAVKELDQQLREIQALVHSGGQSTSRLVRHEVAAGQRVVTRADEARLVEDGALPVRTGREGWKQNVADPERPDLYEHLYKKEPGYPDFTTRLNKNGNLQAVEAYSGRIINRPLREGEQIYRLFGPPGTTHRIDVTGASIVGPWWGLGHPPASAKEWRETSAVLDEWNRDGFMVVGTVSKGADIKACVGTISEQSGQKLSGQYLPGGNMQAFFYPAANVKAELEEVAKKVIASGRPQSWRDPVTQMNFEVRPTGWTDANGIHGYLRLPGVGTVQAARLATREEASKENREVFK